MPPPAPSTDIININAQDNEKMDDPVNCKVNNWGDNDNTADHGIISSMIDNNTPTKSAKPLKIINIDKLIGQTFEMPDQDGNMCKATITDTVYDFEKLCSRTHCMQNSRKVYN